MRGPIRCLDSTDIMLWVNEAQSPSHCNKIWTLFVMAVDTYSILKACVVYVVLNACIPCKQSSLTKEHDKNNYQIKI